AGPVIRPTATSVAAIGTTATAVIALGSLNTAVPPRAPPTGRSGRPGGPGFPLPLRGADRVMPTARYAGRWCDGRSAGGRAVHTPGASLVERWAEDQNQPVRVVLPQFGGSIRKPYRRMVVLLRQTTELGLTNSLTRSGSAKMPF